MTKIKCDTKIKEKVEFVKVKVVKNSFTNPFKLKEVIFNRQEAIVL